MSGTDYGGDPRRAVTFTVTIGADDDRELERALWQLADQAAREGFGDGNGASGGPSSGWTWECSRIEKSHDEYHAEIAAWLSRRRAAPREGGGDE